jgi:small subunit ribosomal protein S16
VDRRNGQTALIEHFMAVKIRMKRVGAKNAPVFRIVVADSRSPRDGKFIEELGTYQPRKKGEKYTMNLDRAKYWLSKGAQPSETVASFIKKSSKAAAAAAAAAAPAASPTPTPAPVEAAAATVA